MTAGSRLSGWLLLLLAAAAPAVYALATDDIGEDFFITCRSSLNLVHGDGLVCEADWFPGRTLALFDSFFMVWLRQPAIEPGQP